MTTRFKTLTDDGFVVRGVHYHNDSADTTSSGILSQRTISATPLAEFIVGDFTGGGGHR
jgi:hypothetical protein